MKTRSFLGFSGKIESSIAIGGGCGRAGGAAGACAAAGGGAVWPIPFLPCSAGVISRFIALPAKLFLCGRARGPRSSNTSLFFRADCAQIGLPSRFILFMGGMTEGAFEMTLAVRFLLGILLDGGLG